MNCLRLLTAVIAAVSLSGCATGVKYSEYQPRILSQGQETGRIFFYRPSALGAALQPDVMLNNEKVGVAISHGFFYVDRPPGEYQVVTATEVERKLSFVLERGQVRYVRFSTSWGFFLGHVYGELVDPEVGMQEIRDCKYIGAP